MTCGIYIPLCSLSHFGSLSWRAPELALRQAVSSQPNKLLILSSLSDNNKLLNALHPSISLSGETPVCNTGSKGALPSLRPRWVDEALRFMYFVLLPSTKGWWLGEVFAQSVTFKSTVGHSETYKHSSAHIYNWLNLECRRCPTENGVKSLFSPVLH